MQIGSMTNDERDEATDAFTELDAPSTAPAKVAEEMAQWDALLAALAKAVRK